MRALPRRKTLHDRASPSMRSYGPRRPSRLLKLTFQQTATEIDQKSSRQLPHLVSDTAERITCEQSLNVATICRAQTTAVFARNDQAGMRE